MVAKRVTRRFLFSWITPLVYRYRSLMEEFLRGHQSKLDLPPTTGDETIFEYVVGEKGEWEHWRNK